MNPVFSDTTPAPSTMAFLLKKELDALALHLPLHAVQGLVAKMLNFPSFEAVKSVEAKAENSRSVKPDEVKPVLSCNNPALEADCWVMSPEFNRVYIDVGAHVVQINRNHEGVIVDMFAAKVPMSETLGSTYVFHVDALSEMADHAPEPDQIEFAKSLGVNIVEDVDQPGMFVWQRADGLDACERSFDHVCEAFEDAMDAMMDAIAGQCDAALALAQ